MDTVEAVLNFAQSLEFKGKHPVVTLVTQTYQTGMKLTQLIEICRSQHEENQKLKEKNKIRLIRAGGGKKANLILEEQIILTLMYLR